MKKKFIKFLIKLIILIIIAVLVFFSYKKYPDFYKENFNKIKTFAEEKFNRAIRVVKGVYYVNEGNKALSKSLEKDENKSLFWLASYILLRQFENISS